MLDVGREGEKRGVERRDEGESVTRERVMKGIGCWMLDVGRQGGRKGEEAEERKQWG